MSFDEGKESVVMRTNPREVEVLAIFDQSGNLRPLRFRIEDNMGERKTIKVDRIILAEVEKLAGNVMIKFRCQSVFGDQARIFELKYERDTYKWYLFKM
ncbi:hypothetical protein [Fusibacter sp. JL216-2]|uniref:hypothetical protein n=1 Tax=Fusibacter sp. JL216-2 TaxID=3071453 RepID=UPI003D34D281